MIKLIVKLLMKVCKLTGNVHYIKGNGNEDVFLVRYIVFKSRWGCLYIHQFLRSDVDDPHDHPWNFYTYVVENGYTERLYDPPFTDINPRRPGSLAYRKATDVHRVIVDKQRTLDEINDAPLTLCLIGPRLREWGYHTKQGYIDWREYLKITPDDPRFVGSE